MPARTNPFQQFIVKVLQLQYPPDAKVEESKMLHSRDIDDDTEVDVVVTTTSGPTTVRLGFECRDHTRTATLEWVRQVAHKKTEVHIDKWFLVNRKGFSARARTMAKNNNIVLMVLEDLTTETDRELGRVKKVLKATGMLVTDQKQATIAVEEIGRGEHPAELTTIQVEGKDKQFFVSHGLPPGEEPPLALRISWTVPGTNITGVAVAPLKTVFNVRWSFVGGLSMEVDGDEPIRTRKMPEHIYEGKKKIQRSFSKFMQTAINNGQYPPEAKALKLDQSIVLDFNIQMKSPMWIKDGKKLRRLIRIWGKFSCKRVAPYVEKSEPKKIMPKTCYIRCTKCSKEYPFPIDYRSENAFLESTLIGEPVSCRLCKAVSKCRKEELIYRPEGKLS